MRDSNSGPLCGAVTCYESMEVNLVLVKYSFWHLKDESVQVHIDHWRKAGQMQRLQEKIDLCDIAYKIVKYS